MSSNVLIYSKNCETCKSLMTLMSNTTFGNNTNLLNYFQLVCLEENDNYSRYQSCVKQVPTMIVRGIPETLVGEKAFHWLNGYRYMINNQNTSQINHQSKIADFSSLEMCSKSDCYAYKDVNMAFSQQYGNKNTPSGFIYTMPELEKISQENQKQLVSKKEQDRINDEMDIKRVIDQQKHYLTCNYVSEQSI